MCSQARRTSVRAAIKKGSLAGSRRLPLEMCAVRETDIRRAVHPAD